MINTLRGVAIDIKAQKPYFANVSAGLSGPAIKPIGLCMVWDCFEKIPECRSGKIPIIGIGGISTWERRRRIHLGRLHRRRRRHRVVRVPASVRRNAERLDEISDAAHHLHPKTHWQSAWLRELRNLQHSTASLPQPLSLLRRTTNCSWWTNRAGWFAIRRSGPGNRRSRTWLRDHGIETPRMINRLDRETSGLVVIAKNERAAKSARQSGIAPRDREAVPGDLLGRV